MTEESPDRALVRRYYDCVDRDATDELVELFAEDARYRRPGYPELRGHAALRRFYAEERTIASGAHELRELVGEAGVIAVCGTFRGILRDGREATEAFADFFWIRGGRIAARQTYFDRPAV